jgi:hypothetical protein
MASDRQQFDRMEVHYHSLLAEKKFSVTPDVGRMAIITMFDRAALTNEHPVDSARAMNNEARRMQRFLKWRGKATALVIEATAEQFWEILDDPSISDITFIAAAFLSKARPVPWSRDSDPQKKHIMFSFYDAISPVGGKPSITHLKQGRCFQRSCGSMDIYPLNIPFPWGFMADRTRIWAPSQQAYFPSRWHVRPQAGLSNLAEHFGLTRDELQEPMTYEQAKQVFGRRDNIQARRYCVPSALYPVYDKLRDNEVVCGMHEKVRRRLSDAGMIWY